MKKLILFLVIGATFLMSCSSLKTTLTENMGYAAIEKPIVAGGRC